MRGHDAIRTFFAVLNTMSTPAPVLTLRAEVVAANGPVAVEVGRWNFAYPAGAKRPPVGPASDSGKYIVHWAKTNGDWVMVHDIWNSDVVPPQPAGGGRR
jgi:ketosteroid isomerase-like protein